MRTPITGRRALFTGAGSGIGNAISRSLEQGSRAVPINARWQTARGVEHVDGRRHLAAAGIDYVPLDFKASYVEGLLYRPDSGPTAGYHRP